MSHTPDVALLTPHAADPTRPLPDPPSHTHTLSPSPQTLLCCNKKNTPPTQHARPLPPSPPTVSITVPSAVNVTGNSSATLQLNSTSTCGAPVCTTVWLLACPGAPVKNYTAASPSLVVGPGGDISTTGQTSAFTCAVSFIATDGFGQTTTANSSILVTPTSAPPGAPTANPGGPYSINVTDTVVPVPGVSGSASTCPAGGCTYSWALSCPGEVVQTFTGPTPSITAGPDASASIDTTGKTTPVTCTLALTVADGQGGSSTQQTTVTATPPSTPLSGPTPVTGGPYNETLPQNADLAFTIDGSGSTCTTPADGCT